MKRWLIIVGVGILLLAVIGALALLRSPSLSSTARRAWAEKSIGEIAASVAERSWPTSEVARLGTNRSEKVRWVSDRLILTRKGEWLAYANVCRKQDRQIHDLFIARGSDGSWYYSTYHFCVGMVALKMDDQPKDLTAFIQAYYLRPFNGRSDDCLAKTWPLRRD